MDWSLVIDILLVILSIVIGFFANYFKERSEITEKITQYIAEAEQEYAGVTGSGSLKMKQCISRVRKLLPKIVQTVITDEMIQELVQNIFNQMSAYAKVRLNAVLKTANKSE